MALRLCPANSRGWLTKAGPRRRGQASLFDVPRPAAGAKSALQAELGKGFLRPGRAATEDSALDAAPQREQIRVGPRCDDVG